MEKISQYINSLILPESVYIESRHGEDLSVYQFSDPTRESVYIERVDMKICQCINSLILPERVYIYRE